VGCGFELLPVMGEKINIIWGRKLRMGGKNKIRRGRNKTKVRNCTIVVYLPET
jgi:hypothetical protein